MDIDVLGSFHVLRFGHQHLKTPGASVINISAPQSFVPMELQVHVCAAKAGVDMLTRVLALEWGPMGIRVNSIVPGPIEGTEGMDRLAPTPEIKARPPRPCRCDAWDRLRTSPMPRFSFLAAGELRQWNSHAGRWRLVGLRGRAIHARARQGDP